MLGVLPLPGGWFALANRYIGMPPKEAGKP
jgi:hypothetical protein